MIEAIVFSKDRACQLDLFLRSVERNAPILASKITVLWAATLSSYSEGYARCIAEHEDVHFVPERSFYLQTMELLEHAGPFVSFFTDDSVFYRPMHASTHPVTVIAENPSILCFSLRLGYHTGTCYSLRRLQGLPRFDEDDDVLIWQWRTGDADFGYMGSLDGHIFRQDDLCHFIDGAQPFANPNQLEDILAREVHGCSRVLAACHTRSHLVGIPANMVNTTHTSNRFGESHLYHAEWLNDMYLKGKQISLSRIKPDRVTAAHAEMEFHFD